MAQMTRPGGRRLAYRAIGAQGSPAAPGARCGPGPRCPHVIAAARPAARLHIVEGGGHMLLSQFDEIIEDLATQQA